MCICVGGDTQPPKPTLRVSWLPTLTALWLEGGGSAQAWRSRSPSLRPTASLSGRFLPRGPDAARPREEHSSPSASRSILGS